MVFTGICLYFTRLPFLPENFGDRPSSGVSRRDLEGQAIDGGVHAGVNTEEETEDGGRRTMKKPFWERFVSGLRFDKKEATAICFCAAAKGMVVGSPTLSILYGGFPARERAILSIPLVLYQGTYILFMRLLSPPLSFRPHLIVPELESFCSPCPVAPVPHHICTSVPFSSRLISITPIFMLTIKIGQQVAVAQMLVYAFKKWNQKPDRLAGLRQKEKDIKKTKKMMSNDSQQADTTSVLKRLQISIPFLREFGFGDEEVAEVGEEMGRGMGLPEAQETTMKRKDKAKERD